jgi:ubiquinone/menaquinone biosynthesis C-methylase UbiE
MQTHDNLQREVNEYFESSSAYWQNIYAEKELLSRIYQDRHNTTLGWIRRLGLRKEARILEVGCGAGLMSVELAVDGYTIDAMDSTSSMLHNTQKNARVQGVKNRIRLHLADVHALPFEASTFDLVIAIGVLPWLHSERVGLEEMQRVLKPGGYLLITADNDARLIRTLDPASCPLFAPLRAIAKRMLQHFGRWSPATGFQAKRHDRHEIDRLMNRSGFQELRSCTVGFGPFTFFGRRLLTDSMGMRIHKRLQTLASKPRWSPFRWRGSHYLVLAAKTVERAENSRRNL